MWLCTISLSFWSIFNMIASLIGYQSVITQESLSGSHKDVTISKVSNKLLQFRACPYSKVPVFTQWAIQSWMSQDVIRRMNYIRLWQLVSHTSWDLHPTFCSHLDLKVEVCPLGRISRLYRKNNAFITFSVLHFIQRKWQKGDGKAGTLLCDHVNPNLCIFQEGFSLWVGFYFAVVSQRMWALHLKWLWWDGVEPYSVCAIFAIFLLSEHFGDRQNNVNTLTIL